MEISTVHGWRGHRWFKHGLAWHFEDKERGCVTRLAISVCLGSVGMGFILGLDWTGLDGWV